jgi:hypothetical protein
MLDPGTYRVGIKTNAASTISTYSYAMPEAGAQKLLGTDAADWHKTAYASGAWTDTTTEIVPLFLVADGFGDDLHSPRSMLVM